MGTFVKWVGSKRRYIKDLLPKVPGKFNNYFEPFLGSASLYFALEKAGRIKTNSAWLSDCNTDLICAYHGVRDNDRFILVWELLENHKARHSPKYYLEVRDNPVESFDYPIEYAAARFMYLNRTAHSGIWRENKSGKNNVPLKKEEISWLERSDYLAAQNSLKKAKISANDYSLVLLHAKEGDFVYFDPPYTDFDSGKYNAQSFDLSAQKVLARAVKELSDRGVFVMLSNSLDEISINLYEEFRQIDIPVYYNTSGNSDQPDKFDLLVTNYE